jgi:SAM-dependent methyltransferase
VRNDGLREDPTADALLVRVTALSMRRAGPMVAAALEERIVFTAPARRLRLALAVEALERHAGQRRVRVLDAGCGDGLLSLAIARRHPSWSVVGIDLRDDMLDGARQRARARSLSNVEFKCADLTAPLPVSEVDGVLALECLAEIPDDARALRMMVGALAPGGLLVIQVPDRSWRPVLPGSATTWREEIRHGYGSEELAAALRGAGLVEIDVRPTFRATTVVAQEVRDRIKDAPLAVRALAAPAMMSAVRLELRGLSWGRAQALLGVARRPSSAPSDQPPGEALAELRQG